MSVTASQRRLVRARANNCCEYCRAAQTDFLSRFQVDHVLPLKHGGTDTIENLCLACLKCNSYKGPNVAALDPMTGSATKLFDPRQQLWDKHFRVQFDGVLQGLTPEGRATVMVLRLNDASRVRQRRNVIELGEYPCQS